jgi:hypothetical protein
LGLAGLLACYVIEYFMTLKIGIITFSDPQTGIKTSIPIRMATIDRPLPRPWREIVEVCFYPADRLDRRLRPRTWSIRKTALTPEEIERLGGSSITVIEVE